MKYTAIIPSSNDELTQQCVKCFNTANIKIFDGREYPSFSKMINDCILSAEEEIVVIINQKIRGNMIHLYKLLHLIRSGYGLVSLQNFHMFGFKKDLIRKIGWFDERFLGGGSEDSDFVRRVIEAKIAWYDAMEVPVLQMGSTWDGTIGAQMLTKKWREGKMERIAPDETYEYDIGEYKGAKFLPLAETNLSINNINYYDSIGFKFK